MSAYTQLGLRGNPIYLLRTEDTGKGNIVLGMGAPETLYETARAAGLSPTGESIHLCSFGADARMFRFPDERGFHAPYPRHVLPIGQKAMEAMRNSSSPMVESVNVQAYLFRTSREGRNPYGWNALVTHPEDDVRLMIHNTRESFVQGNVAPLEREIGRYREFPYDGKLRSGVLVTPEVLERVERVGIVERY